MANSRKYTRKMKKLTRKMKQKKYSMKKGGFWPFDKTNPDGTKSSMFDSFFKTKTDSEVIQDLKQQQQKCVDDIQVKIDKITEKQQSIAQPMPEQTTEPMPEQSMTEPNMTEPISQPMPVGQQNPGQKTMGGRRRRKRTYSKK